MKIVTSKIAPNPKEFKYWADLTADKYGKVIKVWSRGKWQPIAGEGGSSDVDYDDVDNKPTINGVVLSGNLSLDDLGIVGDADIAESIPAEYITEEELSEATYSQEEIQSIVSAVEGGNVWKDVA